MNYIPRKDRRKTILAHTLGCKTDELEYLGSGNFADTFLYKGKVYKLTDDADDFIMANKMIKIGHKYPNFVKVFKTAPIEVQHDEWIENLYLIVSEKITPISEGDSTIFSMWESLIDSNSCCKYLDRDDFNPKLPEHLKKRYNCQLLYTLYNQMVIIAQMYIDMGMEVWDNHSRNLGFVDGKIKIFDMGYSLRGTNYKYSKRRKITYNSRTEITCL